MADRVVIMSRGRIEQIGNPQEIYRAPRTRFVAEFLGSSNVFAGKVASVAGETISIVTPAGEFDVAPNPSKKLAVGDKATFVVSSKRRPWNRPAIASCLRRESLGCRRPGDLSKGQGSVGSRI